MNRLLFYMLLLVAVYSGAEPLDKPQVIYEIKPSGRIYGSDGSVYDRLPTGKVYDTKGKAYGINNRPAANGTASSIAKPLPRAQTTGSSASHFRASVPNR